MSLELELRIDALNELTTALFEALEDVMLDIHERGIVTAAVHGKAEAALHKYQVER